MTPDVIVLGVYRGLALVIAVAMVIVMIRSRDWRPQASTRCMSPNRSIRDPA
jgi:hypothetical protein